MPVGGTGNLQIIIHFLGNDDDASNRNACTNVRGDFNGAPLSIAIAGLIDRSGLENRDAETRSQGKGIEEGNSLQRKAPSDGKYKATCRAKKYRMLGNFLPHRRIGGWHQRQGFTHLITNNIDPITQGKNLNEAGDDDSAMAIRFCVAAAAMNS